MLECRRPDVLVVREWQRSVTVLEVACPWEPLVGEREKEKRLKYGELAADLAKQYRGFQVKVVPVVVGDLGLIEGLAGHLRGSGLFAKPEISRLVADLRI